MVQQRLVLVCTALLAAMLAIVSARSGVLEDGRFDFDNDGFVVKPFNYFRGHDEQQDTSAIDDASDENDEDESNAEQQGEDAEEERDLGSLYLNKQAIESLYQAKPVAASKAPEKHRSYCHPPNPCPKGHTPEKNGCDLGVQDSADWNRLDQERNMRMGYCACDVEHMFTCPPGVPTVSVASAKQEQQQQQQQQQGVNGKRSPYIFI